MPKTPTFDRASLVGAVQPSSRQLVAMLPQQRDLTVAALNSPSGTAAVGLRETDREHQRWGRLMIPAERTIFSAFARDASLGRWLIVVDDVVIGRGPDPVPLTGYRWTRAEVEAYARCGIPRSAIDACTLAFYAKPEMWMMPPQGHPIGG